MDTKPIYELNEIFFHDSRILKVEETTSEQNVVFYLYYPVDWENNVFEPRRLIFKDVTYYEVDQIPFLGQPAILEYELLSKTEERTTIVIETNAGKRKISFKALELTV